MLIVASTIDDSTERIIRYLSESYGVDTNAVRFQFFQSLEGQQFLLRTFTVALDEVEQNTKKSVSSKRIVPTPEEIEQMASNAGVEGLYRELKEALGPYFRVGNTKNTCTFQAKRLSDYIGIPEEQILGHLPSNPEPFEFFPKAPLDLKGWAGYLSNSSDIQPIASLFAEKSVAAA